MKKISTLSVALMSVVFLSGCSLIRTALEDTMMQEGEEAMVKIDDAMIEGQKEAMEKNDTMMKKDDAMTEQDDSAMMKKEAPQVQGYMTYSAESVDSALASGKKVVLFFHAPWCPTCKVANDNFKSETPPADIAVFKVDYDSSLELKKKYGVTYQHTFIALNADGSLKKKSSGEKSYDALEELF